MIDELPVDAEASCFLVPFKCDAPHIRHHNDSGEHLLALLDSYRTPNTRVCKTVCTVGAGLIQLVKRQVAGKQLLIPRPYLRSRFKTKLCSPDYNTVGGTVFDRCVPATNDMIKMTAWSPLFRASKASVPLRNRITPLISPQDPYQSWELKTLFEIIVWKGILDLSSSA